MASCQPQWRELKRKTSSDRSSALKRWPAGIAAPPDYYGYESSEGFNETGTFADAEAALANFRETVDAADTSESVEQSSNRRKERLEDLGYR